MDLERVRAQVPVGATAGMADEMAVILVSREHPQLSIDRAVPVPELRAAPVGVVAAAAASVATAPATVARVPGAHRWLSHGSPGVRVRREAGHWAGRQRQLWGMLPDDGPAYIGQTGRWVPSPIHAWNTGAAVPASLPRVYQRQPE